MKILLENKTTYRNSDIKKLFKECCKRDGIDRQWIKLVAQYQKGWVGGYAIIGGSKVWLNLRNPNFFSNEVKRYEGYLETNKDQATRDGISKKIEELKTKEGELSSPQKVAGTIFHELQHLKGLRHKDMKDNFDVSWVDEKYPLRLKEVKPKIKRNFIQERYEKAKRHVKEKESLINRQQKLLKKWKSKVKYYEKKI